MKNLALLFLLALLYGCGSTSSNAQSYWKNLTPFTSDFSTHNLTMSALFASKGAARGDVNLTEASGLAISQINPNGIWSHNDSGNQNRIYLLDKLTGKILATYQIDGTRNVDWEDIEVGPGPKGGVSYVYLSDLGDNKLHRIDYKIYRFPEPQYLPEQQGELIEYTGPVDTLRIAYPSDDPHHNVESLLLDPMYRDLYIVTKFETNSKLFVDPYPQSTSDTNHVQLVGTFPFRMATAGDISADGSEIFIKNYDYIYYWKRSGSERVSQVLAGVPERAPYNPVEPQGEAIAVDSNGYYTTSEFKDSITPVLYFYKRK